MNINPQLGAQFTSMQATADFLGNGAIEVNMYETEIFDLVRRSSPIMERIKAEPATGHPHRFFEETAINQGAFSDPRTISYTPGGPSRSERVLYIKAMANGSNFGLFDVLGNLDEWCYNPDPPHSDVCDCRASRGAECRKVRLVSVRGGSYFQPEGHLTVVGFNSTLDSFDPGESWRYIGFRVARSVP